MSFFEGLKKVIQGKPVYEATDPVATSSQAVTEGAAPRPIKVYVMDTESRLNGDRLETYCRIKNDSDYLILLDKIRLLGGSTEIDETLAPAETKQIRVYNGEAPRDDNQHDAELQYRTESGVYYKARHDVRFQAEGDRYIIDRLPYENTSKI